MQKWLSPQQETDEESVTIHDARSEVVTVEGIDFFPLCLLDLGRGVVPKAKSMSAVIEEIKSDTDSSCVAITDQDCSLRLTASGTV